MASKEGVVYQAVVERQDNNETQSYIGIIEGPFKLRYNNHNNTFRKAKHKNSTSLSTYIWDLKDKNIKFSVYKMENHKNDAKLTTVVPKNVTYVCTRNFS